MTDLPRKDANAYTVQQLFNDHTDLLASEGGFHFKMRNTCGCEFTVEVAIVKTDRFACTDQPLPKPNQRN